MSLSYGEVKSTDALDRRHVISRRYVDVVACSLKMYPFMTMKRSYFKMQILHNTALCMKIAQVIAIVVPPKLKKSFGRIEISSMNK